MNEEDIKNEARAKAMEIADSEDAASRAHIGVVGTANGTGAAGGTGTSAIYGNLGSERGSGKGPSGQDVGLEPDAE